MLSPPPSRCLPRLFAFALPRQRRHLHASPDLPLSAPLQSYISTSHDPHLNLSIEHHLLQSSHPDSTILFQYMNDPCIVIGRNQNPWTEVDLALLRPDRHEAPTATIKLLRRRSGGGTVWHDRGNVNWSVISARDTFTRSAHVDMVVRALRRLGIAHARPNARHDIVLADAEGVGAEARKVSGSAFKITRTRALHHGTALLASPHIHRVGAHLRSRARAMVTGRGVESVASAVANVGVSTAEFTRAVRDEFAGLYAHRGPVCGGDVGVEMARVEAVAQGVRELSMPDWLWLQTPPFTLRVAGDGPVVRGVEVEVKHGLVVRAAMDVLERPGVVELAALSGRRLHEIDDWVPFLSVLEGGERRVDGEVRRMGELMNAMLVVPGRGVEEGEGERGTVALEPGIEPPASKGQVDVVN